MTMFKYVDVPDVNWSPNYNLDSEEPYGAMVFTEVLDLYFDDIETEEFNGDIPEPAYGEKALYVFIGSKARFPDDESRKLDSLSEMGHHVLLIADKFEFTRPYAINGMGVMERFDAEKLEVSFSRDADIDRNYVFRNYEQDFEELWEGSFLSFKPELITEWNFDQRITVDLGRSVYVVSEYDSGSFRLHSIPRLFSNAAALQEGYLDHFHEVFDGINTDKVYYADADRRISGPEQAENPMQYVMGQKSLRRAYYLTLITGLLFLLFGGKRRQKVIPTRKVNENTSLEYVKTVSRLFQKQNQNQKLVNKMQKVFYHRIGKQYFIDKNDPDFTSLLSRKTKVPEEEIDDLRNRLAVASEMGSYSDALLMETYTRLDRFYKKAQ